MDQGPAEWGGPTPEVESLMVPVPAETRASHGALRATSDIEPAWVNSATGVQLLENRFGPNARDLVYERLNHARYIDHEDDSDASYDEEQGQVLNFGIDTFGNNFGNYDEDNYADDSDDDDGDDDDESEASVNSADIQQNVNDIDNLTLAQLGPYEAPVPGPFTVTDPGLLTAIMQAVTGGLGLNAQLANAFQLQNPGAQSIVPAAPRAMPVNNVPLHGPKPPRVARTRVNLTALSQRYNLYFVAYEESIHIYRPQPAPEILGGPLAILRPGPSNNSLAIGGYIDAEYPHQPNHIVVGDLGSLEVLMLAYDDGDVIGYYTHTILDYIERCSKHERAEKGNHGRLASSTAASMAPKKPSPFFRETAGKSAWGLAIHTKSCLVAVSTNLVEVNVFALALDSKHRGARVKGSECSGHYAAPHHWRNRNRRILLPLGINGSNMPCISFLDDAKGYAQKVVGIDIYGTAWFLDIWKSGYDQCLYMRPPPQHGQYIGWGIMPIPANCFKKTKRMPHALTSADRAHRARWVNISRVMDVADDNDPRPGQMQGLGLAADNGGDDQSGEESSGEGSWDDQSSDADTSDDEPEAVQTAQAAPAAPATPMIQAVPMVQMIQPVQPTQTVQMAYNALPDLPRNDYRDGSHFYAESDSDGSNSDDSDSEAQRARSMEISIVCPGLRRMWGDISPAETLRVLRTAYDRQRDIRAVNIATINYSADLQQLAERCSILRTFKTGAELFSTSLQGRKDLVFNRIIDPPTHRGFPIWDTRPEYNRISLLAMIPELNLVVAGGMFGRVCLLRLLCEDRVRRRFTATQETAIPQRCFRREWVLPLRRDEDRRLRPPCCLLGLAVSPVPEVGASRGGLFNSRKRRHHAMDNEQLTPRRRWRLILHYMDHTVLQYYIEERKPGQRVYVS